jgi:Berberine and berberine like
LGFFFADHQFAPATAAICRRGRSWSSRDGAAPPLGPNYDRLKILKKKYDPSNLFRQNSNINPD